MAEAMLDQHGESVTVANDHTVQWTVAWDWPPAIDMMKAGMVTQLMLKYWYTKPGQADTVKKTISLKQRSFNGTMIDRIYAGLWQGVPWQQGEDAPPPGGGWTMNIKYTITSLLTWYEGLDKFEMYKDWNSGVYLHAM